MKHLTLEFHVDEFNWTWMHCNPGLANFKHGAALMSIYSCRTLQGTPSILISYISHFSDQTLIYLIFSYFFYLSPPPPLHLNRGLFHLLKQEIPDSHFFHFSFSSFLYDDSYLDFHFWIYGKEIMAGKEEEGTTLEFTPTWVVAAVCTVIVGISLAVERSLHFTGKVVPQHFSFSFFIMLFICVMHNNFEILVFYVPILI